MRWVALFAVWWAGCTGETKPEPPQVERVDADGDGLTADEDCDDGDDAVGGAELPYDGLDNDCDEGTPDDDLDDDGWLVVEDCNDADARVNLSASEVFYDGIDNDCDAATPDDDLDGDGFILANDCDDYDAAVNPSALEMCGDTIDNDCSGIDDDAATDLDSDGFIDIACTESAGTDCNDTDVTVHPNAIELCGDTIDNDCSGIDDDAATDLDGDGFVDIACTESAGTDCNDNDETIHPGATENPYDGIDNDCDGSTPDDDIDGDGFLIVEDCDDADPVFGGPETPYDGVDNDCDSSTPDDDIDSDTFLLANDCNDTDATVHPNAIELCGDVTDNDCSGIGEDAATDLDGDGFVDIACTGSAGTDCNDNDETIHLGATENPYDGIDNDCDAFTCDDPALGSGEWAGSVYAGDVRHFCDGYCALSVTGDIGIQNSSLTDLRDLICIVSTEGYLEIGYNDALTSLSGLDNLVSVGDNLRITSNDSLTSIVGLSSLTYVGGDWVFFDSNASLLSLSGLENLTDIGGELFILENDALTSLTGLESLTNIEGSLSIYENDALTSLSGLDSLVHVGGDLKIGYYYEDIAPYNYINPALTSLSNLETLTSLDGSLFINGTALTSLSGLEGLTSIGGDLDINDNSALVSLSGLEGLTSIGGSLSIGDYYLNFYGPNIYYGNDTLIDVMALYNLTLVGDSFTIRFNPLLTNAAALVLVNQVDTINGAIDISDNN